MKLIPWQRFENELDVFTVTKSYGDMSFNNQDSNQILHNRTTLLKDLNIHSNQIIAPNQVHSTNFKEVTSFDGGCGILQQNTAIHQTDALITTTKNITLVSFHADCTPIILYCPTKKVLATIHAGWVGTVNEIAYKTAKHLIDHYQCQPNTIYAYIGPCISFENFEVQYDVIEKIKKLPFDTTPYYKQIDSTHYLVDNKQINKAQLNHLGILSKNIDISPYCTINDNNLLYSHRKKETGRSITLATMK